jgi:hypothetical protein
MKNTNQLHTARTLRSTTPRVYTRSTARINERKQGGFVWKFDETFDETFAEWAAFRFSAVKYQTYVTRHSNIQFSPISYLIVQISVQNQKQA